MNARLATEAQASDATLKINRRMQPDGFYGLKTMAGVKQTFAGRLGLPTSSGKCVNSRMDGAIETAAGALV